MSITVSTPSDLVFAVPLMIVPTSSDCIVISVPLAINHHLLNLSFQHYKNQLQLGHYYWFQRWL